MADNFGPLVNRASSGDVNAVAELLERLLPDVESFLRARAGAMLRAKESGQDLVQSVCREVLEDVQRGRFAYRGDAEFKQWLFGAAELKLKQRARFWRQEMRDVAREAPPALSPAEQGSASGGSEREFAESLYRSVFSPSGAALRQEELDQLAAAFSKLKPELPT